MALNLDLRPMVSRWRVPLLLVWGSAASQTPFRESDEVRAALPRAHFVALHAGDLPHDECPDAFLQALDEFLREVHQHRRLGFDDAEIVAWIEAAGLALESNIALPPATAEGLTVKIWTARRPSKASLERSAA